MYPNSPRPPIPVVRVAPTPESIRSRGCGKAASVNPILAKAMAVNGDIRPRMTLKAPPVSRNKSSSMPKRHPNMYCPNVASPRTLTAKLSPVRADFAKCSHRGDVSMADRNKALPARISATAVLAFISTAPGSTLLSNGKLINHPISTVLPIAIVKREAKRMKDVIMKMYAGTTAINEAAFLRGCDQQPFPKAFAACHSSGSRPFVS
jgi:hypothetical protein